MPDISRRLASQVVPMPTPKPAIPDIVPVLVKQPGQAGNIPVPDMNAPVAMAARAPVQEGMASQMTIPDIRPGAGMDASTYAQAYAAKQYQPTSNKFGAFLQGMNNAEVGRRMFNDEQNKALADQKRAEAQAQIDAEERDWKRSMEERKYGLDEKRLGIEAEKARRTESPQPLSAIAKINRDFENGFITPEQRDQAVKNVNKDTGFQLEVGPDGRVSVAQGSSLSGGGKPLTEAQSKDTVYTTRAAGALETLNTIDQLLADPVNAVAGGVPVVGNFLKSADYQRAEQAGQEFLQAILRKDTGAAITAQEQDLYGKTYLPRPGDSKEVIQQKQISRRRALQALQFGLPPQAILQLSQSGAELMPTTQQVGDGESAVAGTGAQPQQPALPEGMTGSKTVNGKTFFTDGKGNWFEE